MGDYGFPGAGEFGGTDFPLSEEVLMDIAKGEYHFTKCPGRERGLGGDDWTDKTEWCKYSGKADADNMGWGYDPCNFCGNDYKQCTLFIAEEKRKSLEKKVDNG